MAALIATLIPNSRRNRRYKLLRPRMPPRSAKNSLRRRLPEGSIRLRRCSALPDGRRITALRPKILSSRRPTS